MFKEKIKIIFKKYHLDIIISILILILIFQEISNIGFIYKSNILTLNLAIPLLLIFYLIWKHSKIDKNNLLSSLSIVFAVFVFLTQSAYDDDSKIKLLSGINSYNCAVAKSIISLKEKPNLSTGFTLSYFITQPYLENTSFILQQLNNATGTELLATAYRADSANALIRQVQELNVQAINLSLNKVAGMHMENYNNELVKIANSTNIFCHNVFL